MPTYVFACASAGQAAQAIEGGLRAVEIWGTPDYTAWLVTLALEDVA